MSHQFFTNKDCEYFPCHKGITEEAFNCLFCFCPLYALGEQCGGNFTILPNGIKDCSYCTKPHKGTIGYDDIIKKLGGAK